jgi:hypothetical protein
VPVPGVSRNLLPASEQQAARAAVQDQVSKRARCNTIVYVCLYQCQLPAAGCLLTCKFNKTCRTSSRLGYLPDCLSLETVQYQRSSIATLTLLVATCFLVQRYVEAELDEARDDCSGALDGLGEEPLPGAGAQVSRCLNSMHEGSIWSFACLQTSPAQSSHRAHAGPQPGRGWETAAHVTIGNSSMPWV